MSFSLFKEENKTSAVSFSDVEKNKEIKDKLCNKRMLLEMSIENTPQEKLTEQYESLLQLKNAMKTFGISEIDYQIFLTTKSPHK